MSKAVNFDPNGEWMFYGLRVSKAQYDELHRSTDKGQCPFCSYQGSNQYGAARKHITTCAKKYRTLIGEA